MLVWSPLRSIQNFLQAHLASKLLWRRGRAARVGTSKPSVVEANVSQSDGSKASLGEVGLMAPMAPKSSRSLALSACSSRLFISMSRVESGTVALFFCGR